MGALAEVHGRMRVPLKYNALFVSVPPSLCVWWLRMRRKWTTTTLKKNLNNQASRQLAQLQELPVHTRHTHSHPSPNFKVECGRFVFRRPNVHNHCAEPDPTLIWGPGLGKGTCASLIQVFIQEG